MEFLRKRPAHRITHRATRPMAMDGACTTRPMAMVGPGGTDSCLLACHGAGPGHSPACHCYYGVGFKMVKMVCGVKMTW